MFTAAKIIEAIAKDAELEVKSLEKILKLNKKNHKKQLNIALKALEKLDIISIHNSNILSINTQNSLISARIRCSSKGYCFAVRDDAKDDIYIRDQHLNNAWHGDLVLVRVTKEGIKRKSPEGIIQCILERNTNSLLSIISKQGDTLIAKPLDDRILSNIKLAKKDKNFLESEENENIVEVKVNRYPLAQLIAEGEVIRKLPIDDGFKGDIDIVLTKTNLQEDSNSPRITLKEPISKNRLDLTQQPCLILQSWECDDAPSLPAIHVIPNKGGFKIWIHSQTIAERYNMGTKIDNWLKNRTESLCLGNKWRQLLNDQLSSASKFKINESNHAISLCIDINNESEINNWEFHLTTIKPVAIVNPNHLSSLNKRKAKSRSIPIALKQIKEHINQIETILFCAKQLNQSSFLNSTIELDNQIPKLDQLSEMKWDYPGRSYYGWISSLNIDDPNSILNRFILLANKIWNKHSSMLNIKSLAIDFDSVDESLLNDIIKSTLSLNSNFQLNEDGLINTKELLESYENNPNKTIVHKLIKNIIKEPKLIISNPDLEQEKNLVDTLELNKYSPWCCPALNYIDIINQLFIVTLLRDGKNRLNNRSKEIINLGTLDCWQNIKWELFNKSITESMNSICYSNIVNHINKKRIQTKLLRTNILSIVLSREAQKIIGQEVNGLITGVQSYGFFTEIPPLNIDGLVHVSSLQDDWYEYRSRQNLLVGRKSKRTFQLGDNVKVKILKVDLLRNQIDLEVQKDIIKDDSDIIEENT